MRINLLLILFFAFAIKSIAQDTLWTIPSLNYRTTLLSERWVETACMDANFKISMPGTFQLKSDTVEIEMGDLYFHTFYFHQESNKEQGIVEDLVFTLTIYDYPFAIPKDSVELRSNFLMTTVEAAANGLKGKLVYESDITLQEHPGKIWRIHYNNDKSVIRSKGFLIKNRLYLLSVAAEKRYSLNTVADKFFDSFKFLEKQN